MTSIESGYRRGIECRPQTAEIRGEREPYTLHLNAKRRARHQFDERAVRIAEPLTGLNQGNSVVLKA